MLPALPDRSNLALRAPTLLAIVICACLGVAHAASSPPNVAALPCANAALPAEILDGPPARSSTPPLSLFGVQAPKAQLRLAVASDPAARELGLMCVTRLRSNAGMIFVFDAAERWDFWMKNTLIPLDMIWVERDGAVSNVAPNVPASTFTTSDDEVARRSGHGLYVIELPAGEAARDGIAKGSKLTICERGVLRAHSSGLLDCFEQI